MNNWNSAKGTNYSRLEGLLAVGKWQEADQETVKKMQAVISETNFNGLTVENITTFPCEDLFTIDQLWRQFSNEHFGFTVQKQIWENFIGSKAADYSSWCQFGNVVGWRVMWDMLGNAYRASPQSSIPPAGNFPICLWGMAAIRYGNGGLSLFCSLCDRLNYCQQPF
jgi:hypothetical protein